MTYGRLVSPLLIVNMDPTQATADYFLGTNRRPVWFSKGSTTGDVISGVDCFEGEVLQRTMRFLSAFRYDWMTS